MEFIVPLLIAAGIGYLYVSFKKSKKESAPIQPEAPYKVEAPESTSFEGKVEVQPTAVKLRKPGTPKQTTAVKKPAAKKQTPKATTAKKPAAKKVNVKKGV